MMIIDNNFNIGDFVYLRTDPDQEKYIVTGIMVRRGDVVYEISFGTMSSHHYDFELSAEKDVLASCK